MRILGFLWSLMNSEVTKEVIIHQYAMKKASSASWNVGVKKVLQKYHLPSLYDISFNLPSKTEWKMQVKAAVHTVVRGITPVIMKVIDKIILDHQKIASQFAHPPHAVWIYSRQNWPTCCLSSHRKHRRIKG